MAKLIKLQGETDIEQLAIVLGTLGTPDEEIWPGVTNLPDYKKISFSPTTAKPWNTVVPNADQSTLNLIASMLQYNEAERPPAEEVIAVFTFFLFRSEKFYLNGIVISKFSFKKHTYDTSNDSSNIT